MDTHMDKRVRPGGPVLPPIAHRRLSPYEPHPCRCMIWLTNATRDSIGDGSAAIHHQWPRTRGVLCWYFEAIVGKGVVSSDVNRRCWDGVRWSSIVDRRWFASSIPIIKNGSDGGYNGYLTGVLGHNVWRGLQVGLDCLCNKYDCNHNIMQKEHGFSCDENCKCSREVFKHNNPPFGSG